MRLEKRCKAPAAPRVRSADGRRFADIYDRVVDRLIDQSPVDRMPLIHMTAQMESRSRSGPRTAGSDQMAMSLGAGAINYVK
jgi:hypothetical protein